MGWSTDSRGVWDKCHLKWTWCYDLLNVNQTHPAWLCFLGPVGQIKGSDAAGNTSWSPVGSFYTKRSIVAARFGFVKCPSLFENFLLRSESETCPDAEEAALALRNTSSLHDSARLLAPTVNLQLLNGCYKLMVTFQMSNAHTNNYTNK